MSHVRPLLLALAGAATIALTASAANAQSPRYRAPSGLPGSSYTYGADRANPSISPWGWDQDNPRDRQLQGGAQG